MDWQDVWTLASPLLHFGVSKCYYSSAQAGTEGLLRFNFIRKCTLRGSLLYIGDMLALIPAALSLGPFIVGGSERPVMQ